MAHYYFDVFNDGALYGPVAMELEGREAVEREAHRILSDMARDDLLGRDAMSIVLEVRDQRGQSVFVGSVTFVSRWLDRRSDVVSHLS
ncbi:DUF6894 family protein [Rhizobium straminoryzae]|uniref:DUF6894 domain-containing protein n=1 Tax=Rhizobium straminoryzae TaxID=1387186 RepID=A0A549SSZ4_9HYPH|nr:hypothetical protein [Rhizobium straminoryzae]TRL32764.1 hypothetical protein FNA46_23310 [Rhizobium straminoryzae]